MARFLWILMGVTALAHIGPAIGAAEFARRLGAPHPWAVSAALLTVGLGLFLGRARTGMSDHHKPRWHVLLIDEPYYVHWTACLFSLIPSLIVVPACAAAGGSIGAGLMWLYGLGVVVCGYGVVVRRRIFEIERVEITIRGLDPAFDGYRIAQLSDLHIGAITPKSWGHRWVEAANREQPDLAVVTGDMVTNGIEFHHDIAEVVGALRARDGAFVSMGNHDYFGEGEPLASLITARGANVLRNAGTLLTRGDAAIYLAAIDDTWTKRDDMALALRDRPEGTPALLLSHDPERFREAERRGVDLVLSGHTHGGQIALPFFPERVSLSRLTHHYHLGLYKKGRSTLYVHPGLGTTGPPIRLGVAPAIAIITLRAA